MRSKALIHGQAGYAWRGGLLVSVVALSSLPFAYAGQGSGTSGQDGSLEPIITQPTETTPEAGIGGTVQPPSPPPAPTPMASLDGGDTTRYVIFAVRKQDWDKDRPQVPTKRPTGILGKYKDDWSYDGSTQDKFNYHFNVDSRQEGTTFLVVVQTTRPGEKPFYTFKPVRIKRPGK